MAPLTALVHYNGRAIDDDNIENVPYDGPKPKAMTIKNSFTLETLKVNLNKKLGLRDNEVVGRMAYCIPHAVDVGKWQLVDADDTSHAYSICTRFQASAQRYSDNSTPNNTTNPPDEENPLMKDILSDISDHEDDFLYDAQEDEEIAPNQPFDGMHGVGDVAGQVQALVACPPSFHVPPSSQFSDINWEAMDGTSEFPEI
ncbi:hypothetical protein PIB30_075365 [Stylosanthes scabra]|uniref:Ubiquitin-like domain-containing protein n=1 Tax=Stylosanthes scabra TaxID=79078 RepID=A0ABU6WTD6_9FABA|nr:hypothetical protein [Stylosanthes scabra]